MLRNSLSAAAALTLAVALGAQDLTLTEIVTINLDPTSNAGNPEYIGSNPSAVAWDGTRLFIAGYNNNNPSAPAQNCAIVEVLNPTGPTPTFGTPFGVISTPGFRGYSGLDISGNTIAAAYDDGTASANGIAAHDLNGNQLWAKTARGGSGVGFDPGFPGGNPAQGAGAAWTTFGSGRRALQDAVTGADIWTTGDGMVILTSEGTFWRDVDFDDASGDIYLREGNNVITWSRTGDNGVGNSRIIFDPVDSDFVNQQNLCVIPTAFAPVILFNDRASAAGPQGFTQQVLAIRGDDGTPVALDFGGFAPLDSNASYDFSYDAATRTLAVVDFGNRDVTLFSVQIDNWQPYGTACNGSSGAPIDFTLGGSSAPGSTLTLDITGAQPNAAAFVVFGINPANVPLPGSSCLIQVDPLLPVNLGPLFLNAQGAGSTTLSLPAGAPADVFALQAAAVDFGAAGPIKLVTSVGYRFAIL